MISFRHRKAESRRFSSFSRKALSFVPVRNAFYILLALILSSATESMAQNKKELQNKKARLQKEIENTNKLLNQTKKNKSASLNQLVTLNRKISQRSELINTISSELNGVDREIGKVAMNIDSLDHRLESLKKQYAGMLYYAYKNQHHYSALMFLFSAEDFNQAWKRMKYLRMISEYRLKQKELIVSLQDSLNGKKRVLDDVKKEKADLLTAQEKQKRLLDKEKKEKVQTLNSLASREKKIKKDLREKQRQEQILANKIEQIIRKEIEMAKAAAKKKAAGSVSANATKKKIENTGSSRVLSATPEAARLSSDFESNKGRLPWPVDQGFISSSFGRHAHPLWKGVYVNNNGIDINASKGSKARAVFEGTVLRVIMVVDKYAVLVQHGEYFTLYSNLQEVYVKSGDKVITKQVLGLVQTDESDGKTEVHLEIWKGSNKLDPAGWIVQK